MRGTGSMGSFMVGKALYCKKMEVYWRWKRKMASCMVYGGRRLAVVVQLIQSGIMENWSKNGKQRTKYSELKRREIHCLKC